MSFDKQDFLAIVSKRAQDRQVANMPALRAAIAVAPVMEKLLTGSETWDKYLQFLQNYVQQAEAAKSNAQAKMSDPAIWDTGLLTKLKSDILIAEAYIDAWKAAMQLPKALIQGGEEAQTIIARFDVEKE